MPIIQIFTSPNKGKSGLANLLIAETICTYYFSVIWTKPAGCNLFQLSAQIPGGTLHSIITKMITDTSGEITVEIGKFTKGTKINLFFGIQAVTKIANLKILITNATDRTPVRVRPKSDTEIKKLEKGEPYNDQIINYALH